MNKIQHNEQGENSGGRRSDNGVGGLVDRINKTMRHKLSLLYEIYSLSLQANVNINESGVDRLSNIYAGKSELMAEIDVLDKRFLRDFDELRAALGVNSLDELTDSGIGTAIPGAREAAKRLLADMRRNTADILEILKKIDTLDAGIRDKIGKLRDSVAADLARIRTQKQVSGKYGGGAAYSPAPRPTGGKPGAWNRRTIIPTARGSTFDTKK